MSVKHGYFFLCSICTNNINNTQYEYSLLADGVCLSGCLSLLLPVSPKISTLELPVQNKRFVLIS
jgi:hypothetical protein